MLKHSMVIAVLAFAGAIAALLSQLVIASTYGAGATLDAYLMIASVPTMLTGIFSAILNFTLVPELLRARDTKSSFAPVAIALLKKILWAAFIVALVGGVLAPSLFANVMPGMPEGTRIWLCRFAWWSTALMLVVSYFGCILNAQRAFYAGIAAASLQPLGIMLTVLLSPKAWGIVTVPLGSFLGAATGTLLLGNAAKRYMRAAAGASIDFSEYVRNLPWIVLAMSCLFSYVGSDAWWAPLGGAGALSFLAYGQRLLTAAGNLVVLGPLSTVSTAMADDQGQGGLQAAHSRLVKAILGTVVAGSAIAAVTAALAHPIVLVMFQRGSFDATATEGVAAVLPLMMAGMVAMLGGSILMKGLFQLRLKYIATGIGVGWTLAYFCGSGLIVRSGGAQGIALVYALVWWATLLLGLYALMRHIDGPALGRLTMRMLSFSAMAAATTFFALKLADSWINYSIWPQAGFRELILTAVVGVAGLLLFAATYLLLDRIRIGWYIKPI